MLIIVLSINAQSNHRSVGVNEYINSIDLKDSLNWQFVMGSSDYDTNYGIYAKIENQIEKKLKKFTFKIINYKGIIRLGIYKVIPNPTNGKIYVLIQGLNNTDESNPINYNVQIPNNKVLEVEKILIPMFHINNELKKKLDDWENTILNPSTPVQVKKALRDSINNNTIFFFKRENKNRILRRELGAIQYYQPTYSFNSSSQFAEDTSNEERIIDSLITITDKNKFLDKSYRITNSVLDTEFFYSDGKYILIILF